MNLMIGNHAYEIKGLIRATIYQYATNNNLDSHMRQIDDIIVERVGVVEGKTEVTIQWTHTMESFSTRKFEFTLIAGEKLKKIEDYIDDLFTEIIKCEKEDYAA
jgi:hypothetical protein